jgi:hypothetical protein
MPQATSTEYGNSLFNVHMLKKKNQVIAYINVAARIDLSHFVINSVLPSLI